MRHFSTVHPPRLAGARARRQPRRVSGVVPPVPASTPPRAYKNVLGIDTLARSKTDQRLHAQGHVPAHPEQPAHRVHQQARQTAGAAEPSTSADVSNLQGRLAGWIEPTYQAFIAPRTIAAETVSKTTTFVPRAGFAHDLTGDNLDGAEGVLRPVPLQLGGYAGTPATSARTTGRTSTRWSSPSTAACAASGCCSPRSATPG